MRQPDPDRATIIPYLDLPLPRVFAHRGLAVEAPENTLLAFHLAVEAGASYLELDVHASSDGVAVVCHDPDLNRLVGRPDRVGDVRFAQLSEIDLGRGQRFSALSDVLEEFPHARLNIDLKSTASIAPAVAAILAANARDRVLLTSFSERRRRAAVRMIPGVATSASSTRTIVALLGAAARLGFVSRRALDGISAVQIPVRYFGIRLVTPRVVSHLHGVGVEVHVWTINDRADMAELLAIGVDGIVTDRADIALEVVGDRLFEGR